MNNKRKITEQELIPVKEKETIITNPETIITNPETIDAMQESKLQLKHPENGATTIEEFWSDLL